MSGTISYTVPANGQPRSVTEPQVSTALTTLLAAINGGLDGTNIAAALAQAAGVNQAGQTVKGAVNIATSESRTNTAYGTLATPDQVTGIVLPANGLLAVWYQATWQESAVNAAKAAIFLGASQTLAASLAGGVPAPAEASVGLSGAAKNALLASNWSGLGSWNQSNVSGASYGGDVTTGQVVGGGLQQGLNSGQAGGGPCYIFAAAGTYTVSVQFKASSGSVTASNRKLWVQAISFA